eukprot:TRINITY_DN20330_c0_g1_i1.p1 TRINITY_DN20330_c0_g1~~TRINITY_DN20330_c0_g1_i1.p1  ORF type:complete len:330 (+),score=84.09 TRINITY_DN20330_c0_g1_i1:268-1257(+)
MSRARIVIVEGNISAGKSTLSTYLGDQKEFRVFLEPTLKNPYLAKFYQNPRKYALKMQIWLLRQRFYMYLAALRHVYETGEGVVLDRSVFSDIVFAVKNKIDGNISEEGFKYYMQLREQMLEGLPIPDTTLFLDVSPKVCFDRIHKVRCRACETVIPLEYLSGLHECYLDFLGMMEKGGSDVIRIDWGAFGDMNEVLHTLTGSVRGKCASGFEDWGGVMGLLGDRDAILSRSHLQWTIDEEIGAFEAEDPFELMCDDMLDSSPRSSPTAMDLSDQGTDVATSPVTPNHSGEGMDYDDPLDSTALEEEEEEEGEENEDEGGWQALLPIQQ